MDNGESGWHGESGGDIGLVVTGETGEAGGSSLLVVGSVVARESSVTFLQREKFTTQIKKSSPLCLLFNTSEELVYIIFLRGIFRFYCHMSAC